MTWLGRRSMPWREASFAVLDFETTGLDLRHDHVLSVGLVRVECGRARLADSFYLVVRPPVPVSASSIRVHGIRPSELSGAPVLDDVADDLVSALEGRVLVAHAAGIELAFLQRLYDNRGRKPPRRAIDVIDLADSLVALRGERPLESPRLADLAHRFGVPVTRTHHAFEDALMTAQLFLVLATELAALGRGNVRDLERARGVANCVNFRSDGS